MQKFFNPSGNYSLSVLFAIVCYLSFLGFVAIVYPEKVPVLLISFFVFIVLAAILKNGFGVAAILTLLFVLPFNLTFRLPLSLGLYDPYVNGQYINYLVPTGSIIDVWVAFALLVALQKEIRAVSRKTLAQILSIAALVLAYVLISSFAFDNFVTAVTVIRGVLYFALFVVLMKYSCKWLTINRLRFVAQWLFVGALIQAAIGFLQFERGTWVGLPWLGESLVSAGTPGSASVTLGGNLYLRAYGTFQHPNILAGFLLLCFLLFVYLGFELRKELLFKIFALFILIFTSLTFSRTALFAEFIVLCLYLLRNLIRVASSLYRNSFAMIGFTPFLKRFTDSVGASDIAYSDRLALMKASLNIILKNPFGVGPGVFVRSLAGNPVLS
ncbi:hypothetical protein KC622_00390, partial [Candidatus Dojkabacteria bacterium]|nr:hypothetical protein [Candidatus Dojkabacteria bacterium]